MNRGGADPWAREKMSRSDAQRRYHNLIQYQLRPMLMNRNMSEDGRIQVLKRIIAQAHRFRYESGSVAGAGAREEIIDLLAHYFKPDNPVGEELKDFLKRTIRAFGGSIDSDE